MSPVWRRDPAPGYRGKPRFNPEITPSAVDPPSRERALVDGRRDDQAPPSQQHTVDSALAIIPEPEYPTGGSGFTVRRRFWLGWACGL
jgi:hypothetical protein